MRRSNILLASDPRLAVELAADAAQLIEARSVGRLAASIARQQALAAIADHDRASFVAHAAHALDIAQTEPAADDHAVYANSAYVAAEVASGFIAINQPAKGSRSSSRPSPRLACRAAPGSRRGIRATAPYLHRPGRLRCGIGPHRCCRPRLSRRAVGSSTPRTTSLPQDHSRPRQDRQALPSAYVTEADRGHVARRHRTMIEYRVPAGQILPPTTTTDHDTVHAAVAVLPVGAFEQHGPYLPLVADTLISSAIACAISAHHKVFQLPPIPLDAYMNMQRSRVR